MASVLDAALDYARSGFKVIAVDGKRPFMPNWTNEATVDPDKIRGWWKSYPKSNVGICPDERFCILDIDSDKGGDESIHELEQRHGALPATLISHTGGGGTHQYFRVRPGRKLQYRLGKGIELLGPGRQAVEWPSVHPETGVIYEWRDGQGPGRIEDLPEAPEWFYEPERQVSRPAPAAVGDSPVQRYCWVALQNQSNELARQSTGDRNNLLNVAALKLGTLAHYSAFTESMAEASLRAACEQNGLIADDGLKAFEATFKSGWKKGLSCPFEIPDRPDFRPVRGRPTPIDPPVETASEPEIAPAYTDSWARPVADDALDDIPPRQWLYGVKLIRGHTTMIVSPGGVGKTAFTFATAVACASGIEILHDRPHQPLRVWLYNLEEPYDEMRRRLKAACLHYKDTLRFGEIRERLFLNSGRDPRISGESGILNVAIKDESGAVIITPDVDKMIAEIRRLNIDVVVIDPFVMTHQTEENNNADQERVLREFNRIALEANCAIILVHHTRKGFVPGDMDSIRGASALTGAARVAFTLAPMSQDDAAALNISAEDRRFLVRLDDAKMNLAPKAGASQWLKLQSVNLGNGTKDYPNGDNVQVATRWDPPAADTGLSVAFANQILDELARGKDGERYTMAKQSERFAGDMVKEMFALAGHEKSDQYCLGLLRGWLKSSPPVIRETEYFSPSQRKNRKGIEVNESNRPGAH